ncbi:MAG TPA: hypothetical protein VK530_15075, partial [Candidatus Acidoferrum sp.]|nr:hypothetical protein [Candidatus Acidoferrum sp.]
MVWPQSIRSAAQSCALLCAGAMICVRAGAAETNSAPRPKPYQRAGSGAPPLAPTEFNPDTGVRLPERFSVEEFTVSYELRWRTNRVAPLAAPPFDPDPGAALKTKGSAQQRSFFQYEHMPLPVFRGDPIPSELALPRDHVSVSELLLREPDPAQMRYGSEPLPPQLALPRTNSVENLPVPTQWRIEDYPVSRQHFFSTNFVAMTNRYRVPFVPWRRYTSGDIETPYAHEKAFLWHPYYQSVLKGDAPILGQDIFLNLTASTATEVEFRRIPTPSGISSARPGSGEFYGHSEQWSVQNNVSFALDLFEGETVFKPVEWAVRIQPVYNINHVDVEETTVVSPDPRGYDRSYVERTKDFIALQEAFVEVHLRDLSVNYDFAAARVGNQTFNSDFRGFIFNNTDLGARVFGNYDNNRWQYNAAAFDMREKDTYSELNSLDQRDQRVAIFNVYRQDVIWKGYTA